MANQGESQGKTLIIGGIVVVLVLIAVYFAVIAPTQRGTAVTTITCNPPYILVGNSCCLDANANGICDNEERPAQPTVNESQQTQEETATLDCAVGRVNEVRGEWENTQFNNRLVARSDNTYEFTLAGETHSGNYTIDFGNWMHLYEGGGEIYSFNICFEGSKLKLQAREGGFYPSMNRVG